MVDFDDDDEEDENNQEVDNNIEQTEGGKIAVKKKKKTKKEATKIGSEDTLDMIKNALKGAPSGKIVDELSTAYKKPSSAKAKKKKTKASGTEKDEETKEI